MPDKKQLGENSGSISITAETTPTSPTPSEPLPSPRQLPPATLSPSQPSLPPASSTSAASTTTLLPTYTTTRLPPKPKKTQKSQRAPSEIGESSRSNGSAVLGAVRDDDHKELTAFMAGFWLATTRRVDGGHSANASATSVGANISAGPSTGSSANSPDVYIPKELMLRFLQIERSFHLLLRDRSLLRAEFMEIITQLVTKVLAIYGIAWSGILVSIATCKDVKTLSILIGAVFFCALPLPLAITFLKLRSKGADHALLRHRQLEHVENLTLFSNSYESRLEQVMSTHTVPVPSSFTDSLVFLEDNKVVNIGKPYVSYLLVIALAIALGVIMLIIVNFVHEHDSPRLKSIVQKVNGHCGRYSRDL